MKIKEMNADTIFMQSQTLSVQSSIEKRVLFELTAELIDELIEIIRQI